MIALASFWTFTGPLIAIGLALIIAALLSFHWRAQDRKSFYDREPHATPWEKEQERRRLMRERAEARHRRAA